MIRFAITLVLAFAVVCGAASPAHAQNGPPYTGYMISPSGVNGPQYGEVFFEGATLREARDYIEFDATIPTGTTQHIPMEGRVPSDAQSGFTVDQVIATTNLQTGTGRHTDIQLYKTTAVASPSLTALLNTSGNANRVTTTANYASVDLSAAILSAASLLAPGNILFAASTAGSTIPTAPNGSTIRIYARASRAKTDGYPVRIVGMPNGRWPQWEAAYVTGVCVQVGEGGGASQYVTLQLSKVNSSGTTALLSTTANINSFFGVTADNSVECKGNGLIITTSDAHKLIAGDRLILTAPTASSSWVGTNVRITVRVQPQYYPLDPSTPVTP